MTNGFDTWRPDLELTLRKLQQEGVVGWISIRSLGAGCRCCRPGEARPPDPPPGDGPGIDVASGGSMPPDLLDPAKPVYENPADAEEALTGRRIVRREPERFSEPRERDIHPVCAACRAMADERNLLASAYNDLLRALNEQSREVFDLGRELNRFFSLRGGSEAGNRKDAASDDAIVATEARAVRREYEALAASYARKARRFEEMKAERVVVRSKLDDLLARIESCEKGEACKPRPAPLPPLARVTCPSGQSIMGLALTYRSCGACQKLADEAGEAQYRELCAGQKNLNANVEFTRQLERLVSEAGGPDKVKDNPDIARRISELAAQHRRESLEPTAAERAAMKVRSDAATAAFLACVPSCGEPFRVFERDTGREINPAPDSIGRR